MRRATFVGEVAALVAAAGFAAAASLATNPSASWSVVDHCKTGWCAGNDYTGVWTIVKKAGSNKLTGHDNAGNTLSGTIAGAKATFSLKGRRTASSSTRRLPRTARHSPARGPTRVTPPGRRKGPGRAPVARRP